MTFRLEPHQVEASWATLKLEVIFAPKTGSIKPWELYATFTFPSAHRVIWGSFKTEAAANKKLEALKKKYPQAA